MITPFFCREQDEIWAGVAGSCHISEKTLNSAQRPWLVHHFGVRVCEDVVVQAPAPPRLIEGGIPTETTVAQVLVSKYADHLPPYRQAQIYARQGVTLDRSTLAGAARPSFCDRCTNGCSP
jgi:hypothetical protein